MRVVSELKISARKLYRWCRGFLRLLANTAYDLLRYSKYSPLGGVPRNAAHYDAYITMEYHRLEKGLALRDSRPGFGGTAIRNLVRTLTQYRPKYGNRATSAIAVSTLDAYQQAQANEHRNPAINQLLADWDVVPPAPSHAMHGGAKLVHRADIHAKALRDMTDFFESRHSVRDFSDEPVKIEQIRSAVRHAQRSPSVCNRQATRVHLLVEPGLIQQALRHQNGNRGFHDRIDKLLIVTADMRSFVSSGERNQYWIDGGMFVMSLVYGLHSLGLGTCCLNWSADWFTDRRLRRTVAIPKHEAVITMLAVGNLPDTLRVARSARSPLESVLTVHG